MQAVNPVLVGLIATWQAVDVEIQVECVELRESIAPTRTMEPVECQICILVEQRTHYDRRGLHRIGARDRVLSAPNDGERDLSDAS